MKLFEIERKRRLSQPKKTLEATLLKLGYEKISVLEERDTYYTRKDVDYMETVECLRVRLNDKLAEITYKPPTLTSVEQLTGITAKYELNVLLQNADQASLANQLLEIIGLERLAVVHKNRTVYKHVELPEVTIALDDIENCGNFIEVEILSEDIDGANELLREVERTIQVDNEAISNLPYRDIVMSMGKPNKEKIKS